MRNLSVLGSKTTPILSEENSLKDKRIGGTAIDLDNNILYAASEYVSDGEVTVEVWLVENETRIVRKRPPASSSEDTKLYYD